MITLHQFLLLCTCSLTIIPTLFLADHGPALLYAACALVWTWLRVAWQRIPRRSRRLWS